MHRRLDHLAPGDAGPRIEVEDHPIRVLEVRGQRPPGVELHHPELRQRQVAARILDADVALHLPLRDAVRNVPMVGGMPVKACRWKKQSCARPVGQRTSDTGRPRMCGSIASPTAA